MTTLRAALAAFGRDTAGATAVEYGLIVAALGLAVGLTLFGVGDQFNAVFNTLNDWLAGA